VGRKYIQPDKDGNLRCCCCGEIKNVLEFYPHAILKEHWHCCKVCAETKRKERRVQMLNDPIEHARIKALLRAARARNRDRVNAAKRKYAAENPEKIRLWNQRAYQCNPEKLKANARRFYASNKEHCRSLHEKWKKDNPETSRLIARIAAHRRRARKMRSGEKYSWQDWVALVRRFGNTCLRCLRGGNEHTLHQDHIVSIVLGGSNSIANIQPLCAACNSWKSSKCIDYRFDRFEPMFRSEPPTCGVLRS
jgi:5-methylcytosine-specific restriction endonuclease McrA